MDYDLGYIDLEERTLQPLENPFGPPTAEKASQAESANISPPGETEASHAGEQLAEG